MRVFLFLNFTTMSYAEKLKHPKWQKKRLVILERDKFTCQKCGSKENTLHIYYKYYTQETFIEPWNIDDCDLITLCENCYKAIDNLKEYLHDEITQFNKLLYDIGAKNPYDVGQIYCRMFDLISSKRFSYQDLDYYLTGIITVNKNE